MSLIDPARNKLEGVQVLRGVAALLVLWFHLKFNLGQDWRNFSSVPFLATNFGAIGVDIFFVISGFVISLAAAKIGSNWRAFLASRVARIVPLYFAISTFDLSEAILSSWLNGKPMRLPGLSILNTYTFIPVLDGQYFTGPIFGNGWTLSFEMWFYLCFAVFLTQGSARRAWLWLPGFFVCGMMLSMAFTQSWHWYLPRFLFHPMTLEFCAGCILYHMRNRIGKSALYALGGLCLLFFFLGYDKSDLGTSSFILDNLKAGLHRAIVWGGFAACLVGVITQIDLRYSWKWPRILLLLGDASYSIYLAPAVFMMTFEIGIHCLSKVARRDMTPSPWWHGSIYIVGSVASGVLCWKFFELPMTRAARRFLFRFVPEEPEKQKAPVVQINELANPESG